MCSGYKITYLISERAARIPNRYDLRTSGALDSSSTSWPPPCYSSVFIRTINVAKVTVVVAKPVVVPPVVVNPPVVVAAPVVRLRRVNLHRIQ